MRFANELALDALPEGMQHENHQGTLRATSFPFAAHGLLPPIPSAAGVRNMITNDLSASIDMIAKSCVAERLRLLNRVVTNIYDEELRSLGVKVSQLNILIVTAKFGLARPAQVGDLLQLDVSTISRNIVRLRAQGWLEVIPGKDARTQSFRVTPLGKRLIEKAIPAWERSQKKARELLGSECIAAIDKAFKKLSGSRLNRD